MVDHRAADLSAPLVHIVILNWNGWRLTLECLRSIDALDYPNHHVLVVDNGSTDDSVACLKAARPALELIETGQNLGFTGGCNVGITKALEQGVEYVLLFNNDAKAAPEMLSRLVDAAAEADAAICRARVMAETGERVLFDGRIWPAHLFGIESLFSRASTGRWSDSDGVDGCAMLLSRDLLQQRAGESGFILDPGFFMYCEETDLCRYGVSKGYRCIVSHSNVNKRAIKDFTGRIINGVDVALERSLHAFTGEIVVGESMVAVYALLQSKPHYRVVVCLAQENMINLTPLIRLIESRDFAELKLC